MKPASQTKRLPRKYPRLRGGYTYTSNYNVIDPYGNIVSDLYEAALADDFHLIPLLSFSYDPTPQITDEPTMTLDSSSTSQTDNQTGWVSDKLI
jgi:hypothetical protein